MEWAVGELACREALTLVREACSQITAACDPPQPGGFLCKGPPGVLEDTFPQAPECVCLTGLIRPGLSDHHGLVKVTPAVSALMQ